MIEIETPTTALYIPTAIENAICTHHDMSPGGPCYTIPSADGQFLYRGICNKRAKKAGFNHKINPMSLTNRKVGDRKRG